jgi:prophage regulatory protein
MSETHRILRRPEVERRLGLARSTIYELVAQRRFPAPVRLGSRAVGWLADEVDQWLEARVAARDEAARTVAGDDDARG